MKNILMAASAVLVVSLGVSAVKAAPYNGPWMKTWDFSDGAQGFTLTPGTGGTFWDNGTGAGSLAFADAGKASLDLTTLGYNFGTGAGRQGFVMQADVLYLADNVLQGHAIGMDRGDAKGPAIGGGVASSYGAQAKDRTWDNVNRSLGFTFGSGGPNQKNVWMTLQLDYGYTTPGKWFAYVYNPLNNDRASAGWMTVAGGTTGLDVNPSAPLNILSLGGNGLNGQTPWSQSRFDNVKIVPEPTSFIVLAMSALGFMTKSRLKKV